MVLKFLTKILFVQVLTNGKNTFANVRWGMSILFSYVETALFFQFNLSRKLFKRMERFHEYKIECCHFLKIFFHFYAMLK